MSRSVEVVNGHVGPVGFFDISGIRDDVEWEFFVDDLPASLLERFPSLGEATNRERNLPYVWGYRETDVLLANSQVLVTISAYGSVAAVCVVPKPDEGEAAYALAARNGWYIAKFLASLANLEHAGTFSNGEAIFTRKDGAGFISSKEGPLEWL